MNIISSKSLNKIGLNISAIFCALSLNLFVFSLPEFGFGVWPQSETPIVALHIFSTFILLGLMLASYRRPYIQKIFFHRYFILPLLIALCALLFMPFHKLPMRSFLGSVRLGEGLVWWLDFATMSAAFLILSKFYWPKRILIVTAFISFTISYILSVLFDRTGFPFTPFYFPDYLAFMLISLIPMIAALFPNFSRTKLFWTLLYVLVIILMYFTNNNIGIAYSILGVLFIVGLWFAPVGNLSSRKALLKLVLISIPILVFAIILGLAYLPLDAGYYFFEGKSYSALSTIISRSYIIKTLLSPIYDNPLLLLTGFGWGSFVDVLNQNLALDWLDFTRQNGKQWDGIITDHFHSHNSFMEALYSSGVFAMLLWYLLLVSFGLFTSRSKTLIGFVFAGGLLSLFSFWFTLPLSIPFMVFAAALVTKKNDYTFYRTLTFVKPSLFILLFLIVFTQSSAAYLAYQTAHNTSNYAPRNVWPENGLVHCNLELEDFGAGGFHLSKILISRSRLIVSLQEEIDEYNNGEDVYDGFDPEKNKERIKNEIPGLTNLLCQSLIYSDHYKASNRLLISRLAARGEILIAVNNYLSDEERTYYQNGWEKDLIKWLKENPQRTDQAIIFLSWNLLNGQEQRVQNVAKYIYKLDQENPIGLWFYGITLLAEPANQAIGITHLRRALQNGIERFMPIEDEIKAQLLGTPAPTPARGN